MKKLNKAVLITATAFLLIVSGCILFEGGFSPSPPPVPFMLAITPGKQVSMVGELKEFTVTPAESVYTLLSPLEANCEINGNKIRCTPTAAGIYIITVTEETGIVVKATLTVHDIEIIDGAEQTLYADITESAEITFNAADYWTAALVDENRNEPEWITISSTSILSMNNRDYELIQPYDTATQISGSAGYNSIISKFEPNDSGADRTAYVIIATENSQITAIITQLCVTADGAVYIRYWTDK